MMFLRGNSLTVILVLYAFASQTPNALLSGRQKWHVFLQCKNRDAFDCPLEQIVSPLNIHDKESTRYNRKNKPIDINNAT